MKIDKRKKYLMVLDVETANTIMEKKASENPPRAAASE